jgi:signal transduction histidine kinase
MSAAILEPERHGLHSVLVVDDEPQIVVSLQRILRRAALRVLGAESGEEALSILERECVQVVISDYCMRGMDGVTFLTRVKERWPDVQRVMLTGQANFEAVERAINEAEVFRFLNKPWHEAQLRATVAQCFDQMRLLESNRRYEKELAERNRDLLAINQDLERQVRERTQALIQAEKMAALGRMAGGVAHEINNPLGGILAFAQVLLRKTEMHENDRRESLETIQGCALRCKNIVDNLLSFSRKPVLEEHDLVQLNQIVRTGLQLAQLDPKAKKVSVRLELMPDLPTVRGRVALLEQVVVNLLQNAFYVSPPGREVIVRTGVEGGEVCLEVLDQGPGISSEALPRIFEPFFTTKPTGEGTGLGLSICYGIAREHGGRLLVRNQPESGAIFILCLPLAGVDVKEQLK